jgi:hypothetical protein
MVPEEMWPAALTRTSRRLVALIALANAFTYFVIDRYVDCQTHRGAAGVFDFLFDLFQGRLIASDDDYMSGGGRESLRHGSTDTRCCSRYHGHDLAGSFASSFSHSLCLRLKISDFIAAISAAHIDI